MGNEKQDVRSTFDLSQGLGLILAWLAAVPCLPSLYEFSGVGSIIPRVVKKTLLHWCPRPHFWMFWIFTIAALLVALVMLASHKRRAFPLDDMTAMVNRVYKRQRFYQIITSLGIILLREKLIQICGITNYGTFKKQAHWPKQKERFSYVDRIATEDGAGIEYQYSTDFTKVYVRATSPGSVEFGPTEERQPNWRDSKRLLIASNFYPFWSLVFVIKLAFSCF